ncbi:hypothetical protein Y032_0043g852 [Ancylostoma ceylanicum]|uniref:Uncharacterized protein n=1 Tax=Ancylostoma ceylanicum TaxID=53326 RepID=A0A016UEU0_9BILA|nr:hypothetical protein Y032_0043g852 [Ancylostoma ceylanicum]
MTSPPSPRILLQSSNCPEASSEKASPARHPIVHQSASVDGGVRSEVEANPTTIEHPSREVARLSARMRSIEGIWHPGDKSVATLKRQKRSHTSSPFKKTRSITIQNLHHLQAAAHLAHVDLHGTSNMRKSFSDFVLGCEYCCFYCCFTARNAPAVSPEGSGAETRIFTALFLRSQAYNNAVQDV